MITIKNRLIPFRGFTAVTLWPFVFVRQDLSERGRRHEEIHGRQQLEEMAAMAGVIGLLEIVPRLSPAAAMTIGTLSLWWLALIPATYYILYVAEWLVRLLLYRDRTEAYRNISTEQEAYLYAGIGGYLTVRKPFNWLGFLFRKTWRKTR